ncbi:MAG: CynX/NimT family MFS transporter [Actinomycetota bacterium]
MSFPDQRPAPQASTGSPRWLLAAAIVLTAVNLRTAVTSVGPLLHELEANLGLGSGLAGVLTALPVLSFAVLGSQAPSLGRRFGDRQVITGALLLMTAGVGGRALVDSALLFLLLSMLALAGGAIGNVIIPGLIKHRFPDRIGAMTAAYTTAMSIGTAAAAALAAPLAGLAETDGWRLGLGLWAVLSAVSILPWLTELRNGRGGPDPGATAVRLRHLARSRLSWAMALFFGTQALQAYVLFGWFAQYFRDAGMTAVQAGLWVAVVTTLGIPAALIVPVVTARLRDQRVLILVLVCCYLVAYAGMLIAPVSGAWLWAAVISIALACFPLALTLIGLRAGTGSTAAALSAFTQSVGYLMAAAGPLLVGLLYGVTGGWSAPFALLFGLLVVQALAGWQAGRPRLLDDELDHPVGPKPG